MTILHAGGPNLSVAGLVLAAGGGRRYGGPRALVRHEGELLVDRAVATVRAGGCAPVVVVLGAEAARVRAEAALAGVTVVDDPGWKTGQGSALRTGLAALADEAEVTAVVVVAVDQPGVTAEAVRRLTAKIGPEVVAAAAYGTRRSLPVLLGRDHWAGAATLAVADIGPRAYLTARAAEVLAVACDDVSDDTPLTPERADDPE